LLLAVVYLVLFKVLTIAFIASTVYGFVQSILAMKVLDSAEAVQIVSNPLKDLSVYTKLDESGALGVSKSGVFHHERLQSNALLGLHSRIFSIYGVEDIHSFYKTRVLNLSGLTRLDLCALPLFKKRSTKWISVFCDGASDFDEELGAIFPDHEGILSLNGLASLRKEQADALASHRGALSLDGLRGADAFTAWSLGSYQGSWLSLNGITELSDDAAELLVRYDRDTMWPTSPDMATAGNGCFVGSLRLNGLKAISEKVAQALGKNWASVYLDGIESITPKQAENLISGKCGALHLSGISELSDEVAEALSNCESPLILNGISTLSDSVADRLGKSKCHTLYLDGVTRLTAKAAKSLSRFRGYALSLMGLKKRTKVIDAILAETPVSLLFVDGKAGRMSEHGLLWHKLVGTHPL
jgi:hypothetical protein